MRLPTEDAKRERIIAKQNTNEGGTDQTEDLNPHNIVNVAIQTDLTAAEIGGLECDYQKKKEELAEINSSTQKGYPSEDDFKGNYKLLRFYTDLSRFTVLMALLTLGAHAQRGLQFILTATEAAIATQKPNGKLNTVC